MSILLQANELRELAEKATPGPWESTGVEDGGTYARIRGTQLGTRFKVANAPFPSSVVPDLTACEKAEAEANAALIVALRNNLPTILAALSEVEKLRGALKGARHYMTAPTFAAFRFGEDHRDALDHYSKVRASVDAALGETNAD